MKRLTKVLAAAAVTVGGIGAFGSAASAGTTVGNDSVDIRIEVYGGDAQSTLDGTTFELYDGGGVLVADPQCGTAIPSLLDQPTQAREDFTCTPGFGDYRVGIDGVPPQYTVNAYCSNRLLGEAIAGDNATFTLDVQQIGKQCTITLFATTLAIDKLVVGEGDADVSDFELEVYDSDGSLVAVPDAIVDPSIDTCDATLSTCELVALPAGDYTIGEVAPDYGYEVTDVECQSNVWLPNMFGQQINEIIDLPGAAFSTNVEGDAYCVVTNTYREGHLVVTASVTNDDGGTATPADVSIEVFQRPSGTEVIAATPCLADGSCLDEMLPIGDYVIGYSGPDGYTREITQTVTADTPLEIVTDDTDAEFTAAYQQTVEIEVLLDDPAPPTTTTTTTTTLAPTTSLDAGVATLPQTGTSSSTNTAIAAVAALFVLLGGAMIAVRRRDA